MKTDGFMTVGELIEALQAMPQDWPVLTAIDDEGNGYRGVPSGWVTPMFIYPDQNLWQVEDVIHPDDFDDEESNVVIIG